MLGYLQGQIKHLQKDYALLTVGSVGYEIFAPSPFLEQLQLGQTQEFFTHEYLRDNARELYGFATLSALQLFRELIKVSGVGPKTALNVLALGETRVRAAIAQGDAGLLCSISGVGKKTAQKIVLELKGTLGNMELGTRALEDVTEALRRLGYSQREILGALRALPEDGTTTTEEKIKTALKLLGKR